VFALSAVLTVLLLCEVVPSAIAALARFGPGVERLDGLTRLGLREGRNLWVVTAAGLLHTVAAALLVAGITSPLLGVVGAGIEAVFFGWVLTRQFAAGDRGRPLVAYTLFWSWSLLVLAVCAARL